MPCPAPVETLIFVDVDGVLNVSLNQPRKACVPLTNQTLLMARQCARSGCRISTQLCAVADRQLGHGNKDGGYATFVSEESGLCRTLVERLAKLIKLARKGSRVVLSSDWRLPQHAASKEYLEACLSWYLERPFLFDTCTEIVEEYGAGGRLECIGNYLSDICTQRAPDAPKLRVLVIDDFFGNSLTRISVQGFQVTSVDAAEQYLLSRAGDGASCSARIIHTYDSWSLPDGGSVSIGSGLTQDHLCTAAAFLGHFLQGRKNSRVRLSRKASSMPVDTARPK